MKVASKMNKHEKRRERNLIILRLVICLQTAGEALPFEDIPAPQTPRQNIEVRILRYAPNSQLLLVPIKMRKEISLTMKIIGHVNGKKTIGRDAA